MTGYAPVGPPLLQVMTFNVRRPVGALAWRSADRWSARRPRLVQLLQTARPTVLGLQEVMPTQASDIRSALGGRYAMIGRGRGPEGRGEGCPLAYDRTRLALVEHRQWALSATPDVAGSRSWGNLVPRIAVTARFLDHDTGAEFAVVNTHLDPFSRRSRRRSAEALRTHVTGLGVPAVLIGDMNADAGSPALAALRSGGVLRDAWEVAARRASPPWGTFADYRTPRLGRPRLDWILVTAGIRVAEIAVDGARYGGGWASDHLPVHATVEVAP